MREKVDKNKGYTNDMKQKNFMEMFRSCQQQEKYSV